MGVQRQVIERTQADVGYEADASAEVFRSPGRDSE